MACLMHPRCIKELNSDTKLPNKRGTSQKKEGNLRTFGIFLLVICIVSGSGCSSLFGSKKTGEEIAATGPTVMNARANPGTVELDRDYNARTSAEILAEVKDYTANVVDVQLRFTHAPLEIPMEHVSGTTWRATLTPGQLRILGVGDQTTHYEATIVAKDSSGAVTASKEPVHINVKGPNLSKDQG
jgi:hypothetical protein